jgi:hypothetical protein
MKRTRVSGSIVVLRERRGLGVSLLTRAGVDAALKVFMIETTPTYLGVKK